MKYLYWQNKIRSGLTQDGKDQFKNIRSRVHQPDPYTTKYTLCRKRIPMTAIVTTDDRAPEGAELCEVCFKPATASAV